MTNRLKKRERNEVEKRWEVKHEADPVCPYCGHVVRNAWDLDFGDGAEGTIDEFECSECGENYYLSRGIAVSYTSIGESERKTEDQSTNSDPTQTPVPSLTR